jgi:hypothetical protein
MLRPPAKMSDLPARLGARVSAVIYLLKSRPEILLARAEGMKIYATFLVALQNTGPRQGLRLAAGYGNAYYFFLEGRGRIDARCAISTYSLLAVRDNGV